MILVDPRWRGTHGIARFASEVVPRLGLPAAALAPPTSPTSKADVLALGRLRLNGDDLLYTPGFNAGLTRARQMVTLHDLIHLDEPAERSTLKSLYYDRVVRPVVRRAGAVMTVSAASRERILRWLRQPADVEVIDVGNGCSDVFLDAPRTSVPGDGQFLYVGNLKPHKNVDVVFAALSKRREYRLTIVTRDLARVDFLNERHGTSAQVQVRSDVDDAALLRLYQQHDAVLMPSRLEGFGLPALEGIAVGRRVGFSGVCESVRDIVGEEGVSVPDASDASLWATTLDSLIQAGGSRAADSLAWRERYRWSSVAARVGDGLLAHE